MEWASKQQERGWTAGAGRGYEERREDRWENRRGTKEKAAASRGWMSIVGPMPEPAPYSSFEGSRGCLRAFRKAARGLEDAAVERKKMRLGNFPTLQTVGKKGEKKSSFSHFVLQ